MALVATLASLVVSTATAQGAEFRYAGEFEVSAAPDGTVIHHERIAVVGTGASGLLLETDPDADQINVYEPNPTGATLLTSFGSGDVMDPYGIAVDQATGDVYVSDLGNFRVVRFTSDGAPTPTYTLDAGFELAFTTGALTVDQSAQQLLVADVISRAVRRYDFDGTPDGSFDGANSGTAFESLLDLAVDSTGDVIVVDAVGDITSPTGASRVLRFDSAGGYEGQIGASIVKPATVAVRPATDEVVVSGNQNSVDALGTPTVDIFAPTGDPAGQVQLPTAPSDTTYSIVSGMAVGSGFDGRLYVATDASRGLWPGQYGISSIQAYDAIPPSVPSVTNLTTTEIGPASARLNADINPNGLPATYHFEYGPTGQGFPLRTASQATGVAPESASAPVDGLTSATEYSFRVVAENGIGPAVGAVGTFTTLPLSPKATLGAVTDVTLDAATVHATLDVDRGAAQYGFSVVEIGGPIHVLVPKVDVPSGRAGSFDVSARVEGLAPGRRYNVGIYVHSAGGTAFADPVTFATGARPAVVDPPRQGDDGRSPYGCQAPRLDGFRGTVRAGDQITLTGSDLGVYGTVTFGEDAAEVRSYAHNRIAVVVPEGLSGRSAQVAVDCGHASASIAVALGAQSGRGGQASLTVAGKSGRGGKATVRVRVPGRGSVVARGRYLRGASKRVGRAGTTQLTLRLTRAGARALAGARGDRLRTTITVRFRPHGSGATRTARVPVTVTS